MSMIGKTLGNFTLEAQIGKGGMGEVYQAKDQKLGRDVAIKVLPEEFAKDRDRVARFQREAKLLASLNHPNIAAIHGLEESDGTHFLVLELIKGDTLADRLKHGAIPVEESLKLALQITEALEAAHEKGVIHRDLKPANIKVTPDGKVKVLDFGLAKAFAGDQKDTNLSNSPTLSAAATQQGVILGTAAYMSPEQARGNPVDRRADVWAFGCVLYEMLTGRQVWTGATVTDIIAAALAKDPDFASLPPKIHPDIQKLLIRCLQKEPADRLRDIGDAYVEIKEVLSCPGGVSVQPIMEVGSRSRLYMILLWVVVGVILGAMLVGAVLWIPREPGLSQVIRFDYELPAKQSYSYILQPFLAISPDGSQFVYSTTDGLYLRALNKAFATFLPGSDEDPWQPVFSPDGKWIAYWSQRDRQVKKISIHGGPPIPITDISPTGSLSWREDDAILYGQMEGGIRRIFANDGLSEMLPGSKGEIFYHPRLLPDRNTVLFTFATDEGYKIGVQSLDSGERKVLFAGAYAQYLPTGHLVYTVGNIIFARPFDPRTLEPTGGAVPIVEGVFQTANGAPQYAISNSGTLIYAQVTNGAIRPQRTLVWVDRKGNEEPLSFPPNGYYGPKISPDGKKIALSVGAYRNQDVWILDLMRNAPTRLTSDEQTLDSRPIWTPDGQRILFSSGGTGFLSVYSRRADGTGEIEQFGSVPSRWIWPGVLSADGKTLVLMELSSTSLDLDLGMLSVEGEHARKELLQEGHNEVDPQISPDGKWICYASDESGQFEIYVRPFPEANKAKYQISTEGGDSPLWSPDGKELFYRNNDSIMAVSVSTDPMFRAYIPRILFKGNYVPFDIRIESLEFSVWDISPDGKRFLMLKEAESADSLARGPRRISVIVNWFEELKELVPVD